jgi:PAS domain S-box-containing protein
MSERSDSQPDTSNAGSHRQLLAAAGIGLLDWRRDESQAVVSEQCWALLGERPPAGCGWADWRQRLVCGQPPKPWPGIAALAPRLGDEPVCEAVQALRPDGSAVALELQLQVTVRNAAGEPEQVAGLVRAARRQIEQQLQAERRFQELVLATMEDILFVKDEDFVIVQANAAFLALYPADVRDTVIGSTTLEAYDAKQRDEFLKEDRRALAEGFSEVEETIFFPDGRQRTLWTKKTRFEDQSGRRYLLGYARDITELKEAEHALVTANSELEEFAYRVSHDLRSPLQSSVHLLGYLEAELQAGNVKEAQHVLATVQESLGGLDEMARDVLDIHRIRHGPLAPEKIDIETQVQRIFERLRPGNGDLVLSAEYQLHAAPVVDAYGLKLVLENLISNAIKYRDTVLPTSKVSVTVRCDQRYLHVAVEDDGIGIPVEKRDKLFGMFQRFHPRQSFGSGLGLYMTRQWAKRMGGDAQVQHLENGTRFTVRIPQQLAPASA